LRLRAGLGPMPDAEKAEILSDIRNHIEERIADAPTGQEEIVAATIAALGIPETLAASYRRERTLVRAAHSSSPAELLNAAFQWAMTGLRGFLVFLALLLGYGFGLTFLVCALLKPFTPNSVGLWMNGSVLTLGAISQPAPGAHELLGWWIIPIGYVLGPLSMICSTRMVRWLLRRRTPFTPLT